MRIRVCDDDVEMAEEWVDEIKKIVSGDFDVSRMENATEEVSQLLNRKLEVEEKNNPLAQAAEFDQIDILVVDYDLVHLDKNGGRTTGEGIAKLARTYSNCGAIVVMNQFKGPQFDLGMRGHLDSHADVNVDADLIGFQALWGNVPATGEFNPTTWIPIPCLLVAARDLAKSLVSQGLDAPVAPALGLDEAAVAELSDTAFGFLSSEAQTAEELATVTVRNFLDRSLDEKTMGCMTHNAEELLFNFAAFRIIKWLDRAVLRPMDVLIDSSHLIDRLPFLIDHEKVDVGDPTKWAVAAANPTELLRWDTLEKYHNAAASSALGRTVFDWYRIALDEQVDELQDKYLEKQPVRFYLAEDTSRFVAKEGLTRYRADFHNFGDRRAIEKLDTVTYGPLRRMRFG
ncbi:hypothetical protein [Pseudooceanicola atlanticus]|uniref:hypothetical protein n=1 Tax=Pseudooceanicola atlanticus TaxID=1461694 RepID=UPI002357D4F3|nr:hypothetical protein [Pseudooceanicola atlanticus]